MQPLFAKSVPEQRHANMHNGSRAASSLQPHPLRTPESLHVSTTWEWLGGFPCALVAQVARRPRAMIVGAVTTVLLVMGFAATPAQAASYQSIKHGSYCLFTPNFYDVTLNTCGLVGSAIQRVSKGKYGGHDAIQIKWPVTNPYCVDSLAQRSGHVHTHTCNSGNYQWFEVFYGSASGTRVLKSIGAWEHQRVHICISSSNTKGAAMTFATCNTASAAQQFKFA